LVTINVESNARTSSAIKIGRSRRFRHR
jgi:hypothetical protein